METMGFVSTIILIIFCQGECVFIYLFNKSRSMENHHFVRPQTMWKYMGQIFCLCMSFSFLFYLFSSLFFFDIFI